MKVGKVILAEEVKGGDPISIGSYGALLVPMLGIETPHRPMAIGAFPGEESERLYTAPLHVIEGIEARVMPSASVK